MKTNNIPDTFYDHFSQERPTNIGLWLARALSGKIFKYTQATTGSSLLEIGPGRGLFADICLKEGIEYSAVEPNEQMASALEKRGVDVTRAIVPPLPTLDKDFDIVVMINVMEHMNSVQDALQITRQIMDVLKPEGKLLICSPDYLNLRHNFFNCDFTHNYVTTKRRLQELLISAGFKNIKSCFLSSSFSGFVCLLVTALVSRLPFGLLNAWFPESRIFRKLYKMQLTFSRKVLIVGEKPS